MSVARDLVDLCSRLAIPRSGFDPFAPDALSRLGEIPEVAVLIRELKTRTSGFDWNVGILLCLQALCVQRCELAPHLGEAQFVATLPPEAGSPARSTSQVVREMLLEARREVLAVGYEINDTEVIKLLQQAALRGAEIILVCDRFRASGPRVLAEWPAVCPLPRIFHDSSRAESTQYASMHSKALIVDGIDLLVTSANFTFHGLRGNIEFGVRLRGSPAEEARNVFRQILQSGILERLNRD